MCIRDRDITPQLTREEVLANALGGNFNANFHEDLEARKEAEEHV